MMPATNPDDEDIEFMPARLERGGLYPVFPSSSNDDEPALAVRDKAEPGMLAELDA